MWGVASQWQRDQSRQFDEKNQPFFFFFFFALHAVGLCLTEKGDNIKAGLDNLCKISLSLYTLHAFRLYIAKGRVIQFFWNNPFFFFFFYRTWPWTRTSCLLDGENDCVISLVLSWNDQVDGAPASSYLCMPSVIEEKQK